MDFYISFNNITFWFVLSQVFTLFSYVAIALSYMVKKREHVLLLSLANTISFFLAGLLLILHGTTAAWTMFGSVGIAMVRNIAFLIKDRATAKKNAENGVVAAKKKITPFDTAVLVLVVLATLTISIVVNVLDPDMMLTDRFMSFFPAFATIVFSVSVYQNNIKIYRILAIPTSLFWLIYLIYVVSPVGILLESVLLGVALTSIGFYSMFEKEQKKNSALIIDNNIDNNTTEEVTL